MKAEDLERRYDGSFSSTFHPGDDHDPKSTSWIADPIDYPLLVGFGWVACFFEWASAMWKTIFLYSEPGGPETFGIDLAQKKSEPDGVFHGMFSACGEGNGQVWPSLLKIFLTWESYLLCSMAAIQSYEIGYWFCNSDALQYHKGKCMWNYVNLHNFE